MSDNCGPVDIDEHNPNDPECDYAPAREVQYRIRIPLRGGDVVLTTSPEDAYLAVPLSVVERLAEIGDVVMLVETVLEPHAPGPDCWCGPVCEPVP